MATWRRLLEDRDAERVWAVIHDIAEAMRPAAENLQPSANPSMSAGTAGQALFYAFLGAETGNEEWSGLAERLIEHSVDALSERPLIPDFYEGFTGIAWAYDTIRGMLFEEEDEDDDPDADPIAESLVQVLERPYARGDFDLIGGLSGYGIYAFHALPRPAARRALELLVQRLIEIGEPVDGVGFSWFSPPSDRPDNYLAPNGKFLLGVSHGIAAVLSVLGMCAGAGVMTDEQRAIFDRAVEWLLAQDQQQETWSFTNAIVDGKPNHRPRMSWCHGDTGIAGALFNAARHTGNARWEEAALEIARKAARRSIDEARIVNAGLCHGSGGAAHVFNRYYQASGDPLFAEAARTWYRFTVDLQRPGVGLAGYEFFVAMKWSGDTSWLAGLTGLGLCLLGGVSALEPAWDQPMAVSVPLERR
jgi:lantibiotic biosynthesis protein